VSLPGIKRWLGELGAALDFVVIGNNAGQGLPLAQALSQELRATRAAIIYAAGLPEQRFYEKLGYRHFFRRDETAPQMVRLAAQENRPLALYFLNTIQHNSSNYHVP
jgi:hypothetical protein